MRLVSYNILTGGEGRADPLAEVIQAQRADVVALSEATDLAVLERIAGRLGMDYIQACTPADAAGAAAGTALLSRFPIRETINHGAVHPQWGASVLEAVVSTPEGNEWVFGVVAGLDGQRQDAVVAQARAAILEVFADHRRRGVAHVLAGDVREGADLGYVDVLSAEGCAVADADAHGSAEARYRTGIWVYGIEKGRIRSAWVETDRLARYASDHYPVGVEIA